LAPAPPSVGKGAGATGHFLKSGQAPEQRESALHVASGGSAALSLCAICSRRPKMATHAMHVVDCASEARGSRSSSSAISGARSCDRDARIFNTGG